MVTTGERVVVTVEKHFDDDVFRLHDGRVGEVAFLSSPGYAMVKVDPSIPHPSGILLTSEINYPLKWLTPESDESPEW